MGQQIQRARWAAGLTQEAAAEQSGLTTRYLQRLEAGQINPTLRTIYTLSRVFRRPVWELVQVEALRRGQLPLGEVDVEPPKRGRKAKPKRRTQK